MPSLRVRVADGGPQDEADVFCSWKTLRRVLVLTCTSPLCGCGCLALWPVALLGAYSSYTAEASESVVGRRQLP